MKETKNLENLSIEKGKAFLNSFDYVFSDMDGVLLLSSSLIVGADLCIKSIRKLGKQIAFVTNNTFCTFEEIKEKLRHFDAVDNEIITPPRIALQHLQNMNCHPDIYCISGHVLKDTLTAAGYNIVNVNFGHLDESMTSLKNVCFEFLEHTKNVGAIILDLDVNFKLIHAEGAILLLRRNPNIEFICVATDDSGPIAENIEFIGNRFYVEAIERIAKKKCKILGKPSINLKHYLEEKFKIEDSKRVLFIGDALTTDIAFANKAKFQSLVVLTGQTKLEDLVQWSSNNGSTNNSSNSDNEENTQPDYYIDSMAKFYELIEAWQSV